MSDDFITVTRKIKKKKIDINKYYPNQINKRKARFSEFKFVSIKELRNMNVMSNEEYIRFSYFLVKNNYREGLLISKKQYIPDDELKVKELNEGMLYVYNKNTKYQELIDNINNVNSSLLDDYLTILLGFPCRKPNMNVVRYGHSVYIKNSNERCQIFAFMSPTKLNPYEVVYPFVEAVKKYDTNYEILFISHKFYEE